MVIFFKALLNGEFRFIGCYINSIHIIWLLCNLTRIVYFINHAQDKCFSLVN